MPVRKFGLIGQSLEHSWSRKYFTNKFLLEKLSDCRYENFATDDPAAIPGLIAREEQLAGVNVTAPFKITILKYLDEIDPVAGSIGAVNCIRISRKDGRCMLKGYNTDWKAFFDTLLPFSGEIGSNALVLGTGGAARAVYKALGNLNIRSSTVSRSSQTGDFVYSDLNEDIIKAHRLIVNATPVGMFPDLDCLPDIPYQYLTGHHILYDLIYNPEMTRFLEKGAQVGAKVINGLDMLHRQAEYCWEIWNE